MKYTIEDLKENQRLYRENFALLLASVNTPSHEERVERERELYDKEIAIRKDLNLFFGGGDTAKDRYVRPIRIGRCGDKKYREKKSLIKQGASPKICRYLSL